jgi:hypothetical protein
MIIAPDKAVSYAIINAGGFTGLTKHDVAIPVSQLKLVDNKLVLAGATKEALRASPPFEYASVWQSAGHFRSTPINRHSRMPTACLKGANRGSRDRARSSC